MALQSLMATIPFLSVSLCPCVQAGELSWILVWALFNYTELAPRVSGKLGGSTNCHSHLSLWTAQGSEGLSSWGPFSC